MGTVEAIGIALPSPIVVATAGLWFLAIGRHLLSCTAGDYMGATLEPDGSPLLPIVILAGGLATRLRPLTEDIPKAMLEVQGQPFISHQLSLLQSRGIRRVVICVGYRGKMLCDYVGDGSRFGVRADVVFDGERLLGTGGAIKKALPFLGEAFFVLYGDSYLPCDYQAVQEAFTKSGKLSLMTVFHNRGQWDSSNIDFAEGKIVRYQKGIRDPRMQYIDYGLGVFRNTAFHDVPKNEPYDLADLNRQLLARGELAGFEVHERFYETGSFEGVAALQRYLASGPFERQKPSPRIPA
jgi:N-acetyl-alpha-D-muramate 1-phosphate uridylyltransferase